MMESLPGRLNQRTISLIATDLDGTLVQPDGSISPRTADALDALDNAGIDLVLATGRPPRFVLSLVEELPTASEVVCANGAATFDPATSAITHTEPMGETLPGLITDLRSEFPGMGFAAEWGMTFAYEPAFRVGLHIGRTHPPTINVIEDILHEPVYKILVSYADLKGEELYDHVCDVVGKRAEPTHSGLGFVEIAAAGVNKATGLAKICAERGIDAANVAAFGDMPNDLSMLHWAGFSVAMDNAHTDVKLVSDFVTLAHTDDGVAVVLEAILEQVSHT